MSTRFLFLHLRILIISSSLIFTFIQCGGSASEFELEVLLVSRLVLVLLFTKRAFFRRLIFTFLLFSFWPLFICSVFQFSPHSASLFDIPWSNISKDIFHLNRNHIVNWTFVSWYQIIVSYTLLRHNFKPQCHICSDQEPFYIVQITVHSSLSQCMVHGYQIYSFSLGESRIYLSYSTSSNQYGYLTCVICKKASLWM